MLCGDFLVLGRGNGGGLAPSGTDRYSIKIVYNKMYDVVVDFLFSYFCFFFFIIIIVLNAVRHSLLLFTNSNPLTHEMSAEKILALLNICAHNKNANKYRTGSQSMPMPKHGEQSERISRLNFGRVELRPGEGNKKCE